MMGLEPTTLLDGKGARCSRPFALVRSNPLLQELPAGKRTQPNPSERRTLAFVPRRIGDLCRSRSGANASGVPCTLGRVTQRIGSQDELPSVRESRADRHVPAAFTETGFEASSATVEPSNGSPRAHDPVDRRVRAGEQAKAPAPGRGQAPCTCTWPRTR